MKLVYTGLESSGKSYQLAVKFEELRQRNQKWFKKFGFKRIMAPNFPLSEEYERVVKSTEGVELRYWKEIDEIVELDGADVFIDEMILYFDSRKWPDLADGVKRWLTQGGKRGNDIYGCSQDFSQVDKAFRILTNHLFMCFKILGNDRPGKNRPPVKRVWGLGRMRAMNPLKYDDENQKFEEEDIFSIRFFWFRRKFTAMFDTNQKFTVSGIIWKDHRVEKCKDPNCMFDHVVHR